VKNKNQKLDWEMLSDYLDGEVPPDQKEEIERRLQSDPDFDSLHQQLRYTKTLLSDVPALEIPRHFILSSEMLGFSIIDRLRGQLSWNLASSIASIMFVLVIIGDIFTFGIPASSFDQSVPEAAIMMEAAEENMAESAPVPEELTARDAEEAAPQIGAAQAEEKDDALAESYAAESELEANDQIEGQIISNVEILDVRIFRWAEILFGAIALIGIYLSRRNRSASRPSSK